MEGLKSKIAFKRIDTLVSSYCTNPNSLECNIAKKYQTYFYDFEQYLIKKEVNTAFPKLTLKSSNSTYSGIYETNVTQVEANFGGFSDLEKLEKAVNATAVARQQFLDIDSRIPVIPMSNPNYGRLSVEFQSMESSILLALSYIDNAVNAVNAINLPSESIKLMAEHLSNKASKTRTDITAGLEGEMANLDVESSAKLIAGIIFVENAIVEAQKITRDLAYVNPEKAQEIQPHLAPVFDAVVGIKEDIANGRQVGNIEKISNIPAEDGIVKTVLTGVNFQIDKIINFRYKVNDALSKINDLKVALDSTTHLRSFADVTKLETLMSGASGTLQLARDAAESIGISFDDNGYERSLFELATDLTTKKIIFDTNQSALEQNQDSANVETDLRTLKGEVDALKLIVAQNFANSSSISVARDLFNTGISTQMTVIKLTYDKIQRALGNEMNTATSGRNATTVYNQAVKYRDFASIAVDAFEKYEDLVSALNRGDPDTARFLIEKTKAAEDMLNKVRSAANAAVQGENANLNSWIANSLSNKISESNGNKYVKIHKELLEIPGRKVARLNKIYQILNETNGNFHYLKWDKKYYSESVCGEICKYKASEGWTFCGECEQFGGDQKDVKCEDGQNVKTEDGRLRNYGIAKCMVELN
jgi:hypothetical protein